MRFPEFEGEWEEKKLGEILTIGSGKDYKHLNNGKIPVFGTGGLMTYVNSFLYDGETVCIGRKGTIDKPMYYNGKIWTVDTLFYTHSFIKAIPKFVYYVFQNINWKEYNEASGVPSLSKSTIEKIEIFLPIKKEQEKIADFLSLIDSRIEKSIKIIQKLETLILGLSKKLLSKKLCFKNECENDFSDWNVKKLGEISNITTGKLDANAMVDDGEFRFYTCAKDFYRIDKFAFDTEALLISGNGANLGYIHYYKGKFNAYQRTYVLNNFEENIIYIKYYLDCFLSNRINLEKKEGNTPYIVLSTLSEMEIHLPRLEEQTRIANFLSAIDDKLQTEKKILKQYKSQKAYLLQNMFI